MGEITREETIHVYENSQLTSLHFTQEAVTAAYVAGLEALLELTRLRAENAELRKTVSEWISGENLFQATVAQLDCANSRISELRADLNRVTRERDAAVNLMVRRCSSVEFVEGGIPYCSAKSAACDCCKNDWRGPAENGGK